MKKSFSLLLLIVCAIATSVASAADSTVVKSPDGNIVFQLFQKTSQLHFRVLLKGLEVVTSSPLQLEIDGVSITTNMTTGGVASRSRNSSYAVMGVHSKAFDRYNEAIIKLAGQKTATMSIRVFNDGAAFRFEAPNLTKAVPTETTVFNLPTRSQVWYHDMNMHYESVHVNREIDAVQNGEWLAPPATYKTPQGAYASITEAALLNYAGMSLQSNGQNGLVVRLEHDQPTSYPYKLRYSAEDTLRLKQIASVEGTVRTPWRLIIIGADLNAVVNNDIVTNLNAPPDPKLFPKGLATDWVKPGRAVWKYLNGGGDGTLEVMKHFTDGAAALGFEHNILEGFWSRWKEEELKELITYSKQKGVGIWLWKHSKSLRAPASRDSFFIKCEALGVAGVKIDFLDHEAKEVIDIYEDILREAAQHKLLIDFHGANKPTGLIRTYPNELTIEAVKGMEASKLTDRATHETTIPFTRLLAGPAEYTVVHLGARRANTTWAHQIASAAILSSPLLTYAAHPDTLLMNPAVNIIKAIPATWDETIVLSDSEIGKVAVFARRKGNTWFLAVMNGTTERTITVPLTFLQGTHRGEIAKDDSADPAAVKMEGGTYSTKDKLTISLVPGGGFIGMFSK